MVEEGERAAVLGHRYGQSLSARRVTWGAAVGAALLSLLYVAFYLRGGPRIIDATSYYLEARALSEGHLSWAVSDPPASVAGRFLVRDTLASGDHIGVIFPPGYPAVLAVGFWLGAPLVIGPILAAAMVFLVAKLTAQTARRLELGVADAEACIKAAALLTALSACLRYHTADTMSHGLAAVCILGALAATLSLLEPRAKHRSAGARGVTALVAGLSLGWLFATRPVSAFAGVVGVVLAVGSSRERGALRGRDIILAVVGALPPIGLFLGHQHAVTGAWFHSSQALYYATSDGPEGCFRYGFGDGIGCRIEHGDFVRANLPHGFDGWAAAKTTLRRLKMHAGDALNAWPLFLVPIFALGRAAAFRRSRFLAGGVIACVLAYVPFYFDGNYPGGGARFYADTLPLEIVAIALLAPSFKDGLKRAFPYAASTASVLGFIAFGAREHAALRDREGGRPMFEGSKKAGNAIVFVDTDHGFNLGFDPEAQRKGTAIVARYRGDLTDWLLMRETGADRAYRYDYGVDGSRPPALVQYDPPRSSLILGASLWPPLEQEGGFAVMKDGNCTTAGRWLVIESEGEARVRLALPRGLAGHTLAPRVSGRGEVLVWAGGKRIVSWKNDSGSTSECPARLAPQPLPEGNARIDLELVKQSETDTFALDALDVGIGGEPSAPDEGG